MEVTSHLRACRHVDVPVLLAGRDGRVRASNPAFGAAHGCGDAEPAGARLTELLGLADSAEGRALAAALAAARELPARDLAARDAHGRPWPLRLSGQAVDDGWVLTLQPRAEAAAQRDEIARLRDMLDMARELGRLGFWERDVATGEGRWDDAMWRMWGLAPRPAAPSRDEYLAQVDAQDRETLRRRTAESILHPGRYDLPYLIHRPDGTRLRVHARWDVRTDAGGRAVTALGIVRDDAEAHQLAARTGQAQAQLRLTVDLAQIAMWRRDHLSDLVHIDARGWAIIGRTARAEPIDGAEMATLAHPDDMAEMRRALARAAATGSTAPLDFTVRMRHLDGSWRRLLMRATIERDASGQVVAFSGVALDVTERLEASQRELDLARRLEIATAAAGVATWDHLPGAEWHWDAQMHALHRIAPGEQPPDRRRYIAEVIHPEDRAAVYDAMEALRRRREGMVDLDFRIRRSDGEVRRLATRTTIELIDGEPRMLGVMLDVTERHAAELRLREAAERTLLVTRSAGIGTWEALPDGRSGHWDEQMFRLRGLEPRSDPLSVDEMLACVHPDDRAQVAASVAAMDNSGLVHSREFRVVWPDGTVRWLASRSTPVRDDGGHLVGRIGINWDVTEAHQIATERQERLLAQRESQAKSRFLARMSHELRTPLNAVIGFSQLLLAGGGPDTAAWRCQVEHVRAAGEHLLTLINDVLDLSSLESGELPLTPQPVVVADLVRTTLPLLHTQAEAAGVRIRLGRLDGCARANPVRLRQVLINLLSNAIKYNHRGGEVRIEAAPSRGELRLAVQDTGMGLSETQLAHLFEPFNRLGREQQGIDGTGIGLAIVHASVQRMNGRIAVRSRPGEGSCFEVWLPLAETATLPAAAGEPVVDAGEGLDAATGHRAPPRRRVLYIEDNPVNLLIVSELLRQRPDVQLDTAVNGLDGLALARRHRPAVVLIDMQLPDIDGLEVLRRLRADPATAALHCVAVSANAMPDDIRTALQEGFDDYWTKPLDLGRTIDALHAIFGRPPSAIEPAQSAR